MEYDLLNKFIRLFIIILFTYLFAHLFTSEYSKIMIVILNLCLFMFVDVYFPRVKYQQLNEEIKE